MHSKNQRPQKSDNHKICEKPFGRVMEPKIFWSASSGKGRGEKRFFQQDLNPDGPPARRAYTSESDWCRKADTEKPKETPAKVGMLLTEPPYP